MFRSSVLIFAFGKNEVITIHYSLLIIHSAHAFLISNS